MDLPSIRLQINHVDEKLLELMIQRMGLIKDVARIKKQKNLPVYDPKREALILKGLKAKLPNEYGPYIEELCKAMFTISKNYQEKLLSK